MTIRDEIIGKIKAAPFVTGEVTEEMNLYRDLGFDSLAFIRLLLEVESSLRITFDITEMEACQQVGVLIALAENKRKERMQ